MKVAVVGLGSMGKRRIRLMKQYAPDLEIIGVDHDEKRCASAREEFGIRICDTLERLCGQETIDCGFVCTSPLSHCQIIRQFIQYGISVFTEMNLIADGYEEFIQTKQVKLFLSSTFLYRRDLAWVIDRVRGQRVDYIYHTGQYLPDWHPWEDYRHFFVADKRTNGCREILAIELPWMIACFGEIRKVTVKKDNLSGLEIDYPDNYIVLLEHENGSKGMLAADVVARKAIRRLEIYNEQMEIRWDGTPDSLEEWDVGEGKMRPVPVYDDVMRDARYCDTIIENAYMDEIAAFFAWLKGDASQVRYSFRQDIEVLRLIDEIEA